MEAPSLTLNLLLIIIVSLLFISLPRSEPLPENPSFVLLSDGFEWPTSHGDTFDIESFDDAGEEEDDDVGVSDRRSLYWKRRRYYGPVRLLTQVIIWVKMQIDVRFVHYNATSKWITQLNF
ncbi:unnamed protein product [Brassica rapa]|uniref:Transmembrane protein n=1 Tax=Brassica campestris TaxID=3711 RepID=A0A3P5YHE6_BRACM|nr:unnamed protein product [Brassica rapa]VDC62305.1 unnamed protein product [Brassica rapa]